MMAATKMKLGTRTLDRIVQPLEGDMSSDNSILVCIGVSKLRGDGGESF